MDEDDVGGPDQPEPRGKTEQQLFDEQIARASGKTVVMFGGLGILAALVLSTVALVISASKSTTTVRVAATPTAGQTAGTGQSGGSGQAPQLTGDALGAQLFVSGKPDTGAIGCGSCHTMKAAGASGTIGPNLDKELTADPASATRESIVDPNKEIIPGYSANVMPTNYGTALTNRELDALVNYVYHSTNAKAKAKAASLGEDLPHPVATGAGRQMLHCPEVATHGSAHVWRAGCKTCTLCFISRRRFAWRRASTVSPRLSASAASLGRPRLAWRLKLLRRVCASCAWPRSCART